MPRFRHSCTLGALSLALVLVFLGRALGQDATDPGEKAKGLFQKYTMLEAAADPGVLDLYDTAAKIEIYKADPKSGTRIRQSVPLDDYKTMLKTGLNSTNPYVYSDVTYTVLGDNVKIRAMRIHTHPDKKEKPLPFQVMTGPGANGQWSILIDNSVYPDQPNQ